MPQKTACAIQRNPDGSAVLVDGQTVLATTTQGFVQFTAKDENDNLITFADFMKTDEGKKMAGPTGGVQGFKGTLFGVPYEAGSWQDKLLEAFSGTHDFIGGKMSGLYDAQGNIKRGMTEVGKGPAEPSVDLSRDDALFALFGSLNNGEKTGASLLAEAS